MAIRRLTAADPVQIRNYDALPEFFSRAPVFHLVWNHFLPQMRAQDANARTSVVRGQPPKVTQRR